MDDFPEKNKVRALRRAIKRKLKIRAIAAWNRRNPPAAVPDGWLEAMKIAEKALHPFYAAVFNDNGDMTVSGSYPYHEAIAGYHAYKRVRAMISAAPAAPTGWQLADTAPDDTEVFAWNQKYGGIYLAIKQDGEWWVPDLHPSNWEPIDAPTHWMPLPAAPTAPEGQ